MKIKPFLILLLGLTMGVGACSKSPGPQKRAARKAAKNQPVPQPDVTAGELIGNWFRVETHQTEGLQFFSNGDFISFEPVCRGQWEFSDSLLVLKYHTISGDSVDLKKHIPVRTNQDGSVSLLSSTGVDSLRLRKFEVKLEFDKWLGYWPGPDSTGLIVSPINGKYQLQIRAGDSTATYEATPTSQGLKFTRAGREEFLRAASGFETGIKEFMEQSNCLVIRKSEGFCRTAAFGSNI